MAAIPRIDPERVLNHKFADMHFEYTERDVALYALGVGAPGDNPVDPSELPYVYHPDGQKSIKVLPSFAVCYPGLLVETIGSIDGLHYDRELLLHLEQYVELYKPLPTCGQIRTTVRVSGLHDKGKAAIIELELLSHDAVSGDTICLNRVGSFLRGAGGFSPGSQRYSYTKRTSNLKQTFPSDGTKKGGSGDSPDFVYEDCSKSSQALLYRLSGDYNSIHSDPVVAKRIGFERPILHGLCTLGFAVRAVVRSCCKGDPTRVQNFQGRFLSHVFPGDKLTTEMWLDPQQSRVTYTTKSNGRTVLSGTMILTPIAARL